MVWYINAWELARVRLYWSKTETISVYGWDEAGLLVTIVKLAWYGIRYTFLLKTISTLSLAWVIKLVSKLICKLVEAEFDKELDTTFSEFNDTGFVTFRETVPLSTACKLLVRVAMVTGVVIGPVYLGSFKSPIVKLTLVPDVLLPSPLIYTTFY